MGFLDTLLGNADQTQALGLLGAGWMSRNPSQGFLLASEHLAGASKRKMQEQFQQMQMQELQSQIEARRLKAAQEQAEMERRQRIQQGIPGLFKQPGFTGGEPMPQTEGGIPMFSRPMGAAPMQSTPGGFDVQGALRLGVPLDDIPKLASLQDTGRPKATRQMEVDDGRGGKRIALVDDFGREVAGFAGYTAPVQVSQGDRVSFVKPAPGVSLPVNMSPDAKASNALGWANHALTRRGQDLTDARARESAGAGRIPAGYRLAANGEGLEYIPGGPADPNAAKRAAPTEFQGKSAIYGTRAQEADKIITSLDGKYNPAAVNAKTGVAGVPLIGGALEAAGNFALSESGQKAEQAQRDFINAVLRQESGAVISEQEFANAKRQYFPQPFDSAAVKAQKAQNRRLAIQGILNNARTTGEVPQQGGATGSWDKAPSVDELVKKYGGK